MAASVARAAHKVIDPFAPSLHDDPLAAPEGESSTSRIRRPTVKLDEDRLLNHPDGMKKLITHAQTFKPGLKGSEVSPRLPSYHGHARCAHWFLSTCLR